MPECFTLIGSRTFKSKANKFVNMVSIADEYGNTFKVFVDDKHFDDFVEQYLMKDITHLVSLNFFERVLDGVVVTGYYPSINF